MVMTAARERVPLGPRPVAVAATGAGALNLVAAVPPLRGGYLEFGLIALVAATGVAYAVCAVVASGFGASTGTVGLMLTGSVVTSLTGLWLLTDSWNPLWPLLWAGAVLPVPVSVLLALSYPVGRIRGGIGRAVAALALGTFLLLAAVRLLTYDPGAWGFADATRNVFAVVDSPSGGPDLARLYLGSQLVVATAALVAVGAQWWRGSAPWRAVNLLMASAFALLASSWIWFSLTVLVGGFANNTPAQYLTYLMEGCLPVIYVVSLGRQRATRSRVADLLLAERHGIVRERWDELVVEALDDPSARLLWSEGGGWVTSSGAPCADPRERPGDSWVPVGDLDDADDAVAVIVHDPAVSARRELLESVAEAVRLAVTNERLSGRLLDAGDAERRHIERDLHDGVQQLLVSATIQARLVAEQVGGGDDEALRTGLAELEARLRVAGDELRRTVRGITPTALAHGGVVAALEELVLHSGVPTRLDVVGDHEPDQRIQTSIYYLVAECLTNVHKHAGASRVSVRLELGDRSVVSVEDDGDGGADPTGRGLRGLADRVAATGGALRVESAPGHGTRVEAVL